MESTIAPILPGPVGSDESWRFIDSSKHENLFEDQTVKQPPIFRSIDVSLSTSYIFVATTIKKTINLAVDGSLKCMPLGFVVC